MHTDQSEHQNQKAVLFVDIFMLQCLILPSEYVLTKEDALYSQIDHADNDTISAGFQLSVFENC